MTKTIAGARRRRVKKSGKSVKSTVNTGKNAGEREDMLYAVEGERRDSASPETPEITPKPWMSSALIEKTHQVWSRAYGRPLERAEVIEILQNVRWFGELLRKVNPGGKKDECGDMGAGEF